MIRTIILFFTIIIIINADDSNNVENDLFNDNFSDANLERETSSQESKKKDFLNYSLETNFYPKYEYIIYENELKTSESYYNFDKDLYFQASGKQDDFSFEIKFSNQEELETNNLIYGKYKKFEFGDVQIDSKYKSVNFKNSTKIFGAYFPYLNSSILFDIDKNSYKRKKINLDNTRNEKVFRENSYIKNSFIEYEQENIDTIYFEDFSDESTDEKIEINNRYYTEFIYREDYIFYRDFIELLNPKDGAILIKNRDGEYQEAEFNKKIFFIDLSNSTNYVVQFYEKNQIVNNMNYQIDNSTNRFILDEELDADQKVEIIYYSSTEIVNIGNIEGGSLRIYSGERLLKKDEDYFFDKKTGVITFMDNSGIMERELDIFYKEKKDGDNYYFSTNINYENLYFRYDFDLQNIEKTDTVGLIYSRENLYSELGAQFYNPDIYEGQPVIDFNNIYEDYFISTLRENFSRNKNIVSLIEDRKTYSGEEDIEEKLKIGYKNGAIMRQKVENEKIIGDKLSLQMYGNNSNNILRVKVGKYVGDIESGRDLEDYEKIDIEIDFFGWNEVIVDIPNTNLKEFTGIEYEFISEDDKKREIIIGSVYIKKNLLSMNKVDNFKIDENIYFEGNSEDSYIEKKLSKSNNYKKLIIETFSNEITNLRIDIDGENIYSAEMIGRNSTEIDIRNIENIYNLRIYSDNKIEIKKIDFRESKKDLNYFYYLKYNKNKNIFEYKLFGEDEYIGIKNNNQKSIINYDIFKERKEDKEKKQFYLETSKDGWLNFRYKYFLDKHYYREYDIFYLKEKNRAGAIYRKDEYYKAYLKYISGHFNTENEVKREEEGLKYEYKGEANYFSEILRTSYKYNYIDDLENRFNFFISNEKNSRNFDFRIVRKKEYWYEYTKTGTKIGEPLRLEIKREYEAEYDNIEEKWFFPIIKYIYIKNMTRVNFDFEYQIGKSNIETKLNLFTKFFRWDIIYKKQDIQEIDSKIFIFTGERFEMNLDTKYIIDSSLNNSIRVQNGISYQDGKYRYSIELIPFIGIEFNNNIENNYDSYKKYEIGSHIRIIM